MSETESTDPIASYDGSTVGRPRGGRRQKIYGYLKAANELRQSYQSQWAGDGDGARDDDMPGSFPDMEIVRSGDEEMVLFPSYARKHLKKHQASSRDKPGAHEDIERPHSSGDADYWKRQWEIYEDDNAIVDVDVRGWIFSPPKGQLNRKNRLLIAVARRLSGIPAPTTSPNHSRASSQHSVHRERLEERSSRHEDQAAAKEAQRLAQRGEAEADAAWRGNYSQDPNGPSPFSSRSASPVRTQLSHTAERPKSLSEFSMVSDDDDPGKHSLAKRRSWAPPGSMSKEELATAHAHLMARLKPFMTMPLVSTPITVFFFNDDKSQSKSVHTNDSGHFNVRASLGFVPTHVRVLASEKLSATEPVIITEAKGISLISDIDDTIKHSAIAGGAKEIFRNTFIRELQDLTIQGVKEWYTKLYNMGVKLHYVSNSPWQLFPLLKSYFSLAGLPPGSFHLKQYSGMLQGIFEPAAERKRGSLDRIMSDFPERRFVLVGDSGEADLEVYTDVVMANPGRVLAVYIRDVTTTEPKKFFDQAVYNDDSGRTVSRNRTTKDTSRDGSSGTDTPPALPVRRNALSDEADKESSGAEGDLITFEEPNETSEGSKPSYAADLLELHDADQDMQNLSIPDRPRKPEVLRGGSSEMSQPTNHDRLPSTGDLSRNALQPPQAKSPPPKPRRPSASVTIPSQSQLRSQSQRAPFSSGSQNQAVLPSRPKQPSRTSSSSALSSLRPKLGARPSTLGRNGPPQEDEGYAASAKRQLNSAYNALPSLRSSSPTRNELEFRPRNPSDPTSPGSRVPPPVPPRRGLTSYPVAAARWATGASGGDLTAEGGGGAPAGAPYNKKEEMWRRRWARANDIMRREGVVLRSWRVGTDVMDECVKIVEANFWELKHMEGGLGSRRL